MAVKEYRKTATVKAEQFDGSKELMQKYNITKDDETNDFKFLTLEGIMHFNLGDYICTGAVDEHWAVRKDVFEKTYKEI